MPDTPVEPRPDEPYHPALEFRVSRLETDVQDIRSTLTRLEAMVAEIKATLDATLPHLATKAELGSLRTELKADLASVRQELSEKPSKTYMWGVLTALLTAYACGLAALAILK